MYSKQSKHSMQGPCAIQVALALGYLPWKASFHPYFMAISSSAPSTGRAVLVEKKVAADQASCGEHTHTPQHHPPPPNKQPKVQIAVVCLDLTEALVSIVVHLKPLLGFLEFCFPWLWWQMVCYPLLAILCTAMGTQVMNVWNTVC